MTDEIKESSSSGSYARQDVSWGPTEDNVCPSLGYAYDPEYGWPIGDHVPESLLAEFVDKYQHIFAVAHDLVELKDGPRDENYYGRRDPLWDALRKLTNQ